MLGEDMHPDYDLNRQWHLLTKMKLVKDITQFLPMHGRKIWVDFKNMTKLCTNCYGYHTICQCTNMQVPWIIWVRDFMMKNPDITDDFYGNWWEVVDKEFPGYFKNNDEEELFSRQTQSQTQEQPCAVGTQSSATNQPQPIQDTQQQQLRHPPVNMQLCEKEELSALMQRGPTLNDASNYMKNKTEQEHME